MPTNLRLFTSIILQQITIFKTARSFDNVLKNKYYEGSTGAGHDKSRLRDSIVAFTDKGFVHDNDTYLREELNSTSKLH